MAAADKNQYVPAFGQPHPILVQLHSEENHVLSPGKDVVFTLTHIKLTETEGNPQVKHKVANRTESADRAILHVP